MPEPTRRARTGLSACLIGAVLLTGCGTHPDPAAGTPAADPGAGFPVSVTDCGVTTTYTRAPAHAVTMNQHATENLLALGLAPAMRGTAYLDDDVLPAYRDAYRSVPVLAARYPSAEVLLNAEPDFVYGGFSSAFSTKDGRDRQQLGQAGIDSYLSLEQCATAPVTADLLDTELTNLGDIFGVPARAREQIDIIHRSLDRTRSAIAGAVPVSVAVYDSGQTSVFTAGGQGIGNDIIDRAGGRNVFADLPKPFGDVSFEQLADRSPEVIVIYDYGDTTVESKRAALLANPALQRVPAVRDRRFAVLPLSSTVLGVRVPDAVAALARQLHPDRFQ